jgi:glucose-6-phosphate isomerase
MTQKTQQLTNQPAWKALSNHLNNGIPHLRELFKGNDHRAGKMSLETEGLFLDYSKNRITDETLALLLKLAEDTGLREKIDAMFRGEKSTSPKTGLFCMWLCVRPQRLSLRLMAKM